MLLNFCTFILFSYINVCIELVFVSHIWEQLYINLHKIIFNIFLFKVIPMFYILLYFMS